VVGHSAHRATTDWARAADATPEQMRMLLGRYREMLEMLYEHELLRAELIGSLSPMCTPDRADGRSRSKQRW